MLKRSFWLLLAAVAGALIWAWARQRRDEFSDHTPQFTPPRQFTAPPPGTFAPADDDQVAPAEAPAEAEPPAEAQVATPDEAEAPAEAPAVAEPPSEVQAATPDDDQVAPADAAQDEILGYCVRCRTKRPMQHAHEETTESGRRAARGSCPVCGANMFTFLAANDDDHGADA